MLEAKANEPKRTKEKMKMKRQLILFFLIFLSIPIFGQVEKTSELYTIIKGKDSLLFNLGFNNCDIKRVYQIGEVIIKTGNYPLNLSREQNINIRAKVTNTCEKPWKRSLENH